jgi:Stage II sporulation protein E (SpoIIE)
VPAATTLDQHSQLEPQDAGRRTDPLLPVLALPPRLSFGSRPPSTTSRSKRNAPQTRTPSCSVNSRLRAQLPAFAPLLEEIEIAGCSCNRFPQRGNFHDWMLLGSDRVLVMAGHAANPEPQDPEEPALVAQAAWTAIRAHAVHTRDAGTLLSLAAQTVWSTPEAAIRAAVAVALVDTGGGRVSVALAGDCLAWRIRAASCEQFTIRQPLLGAAAEFAYLSHSFELSLRERLILAVDDTLLRPARLASGIASSFSHLDAESHRRMTAADAVALVCEHYDRAPAASAESTSASIAAIRRR